MKECRENNETWPYFWMTKEKAQEYKGLWPSPCKCTSKWFVRGLGDHNMVQGTHSRSDKPPTQYIFLLYCIVLGITFAFVSYRFAFQPIGSEFLGVYLGAVTLPWSIAVMPLLALATPEHLWFNVLVLLACGVLNALLLRRLCRRHL
jgi:hypothetical protein